MIEYAVRSTGIDADIEISRFITAYERFNPNKNRAPLFKLVVPSSVDERLLLGIRVIGYCGVRIEAMKKSGIIQCRKCQRLHHTTGQCNFNYRCVQCVSGHEWGACPRRDNKAIPIGCVNCMEAKLDHTQHTANDLKNCHFVKKIEANKTAKKTGQRQTPLKIGQGERKFVSTTTSIPKASKSDAQRTSYSAALAGSVTNDNKLEMNGIDIERIIAMTIQGVLAAIRNGL